MKTVTSTAIKWLERHAKDLRNNGSVLMLADVDPAVRDTLRRSGAIESPGLENIFPTTPRVLEAEKAAWAAAQTWLAQPP